ncbi:MAG: hypothetical protein GX446_09725 [Chthonomonadales bacterium]|nr:hypothetical protein [Chthonomonadales bacterium]
MSAERDKAPQLPRQQHEARDEALWRFLNEADASPACVDEWVQKYPEFADDFVALSLYRDVVPEATAQERVEFSEAAGLPGTAGSTARTMLRAMRARKQARRLPSIVEGARTRGMSPRDLADVLRIGLSVLTRLERRLLDPETVPAKIVRAIGDAIGATGESVIAYLRQPPTLSASASYRSAKTPTLGVAEDGPRGRLRRDAMPQPQYQIARAADVSRTVTHSDGSGAGDDLTPDSDQLAPSAAPEIVRQDFMTAVLQAPDMDDADKAWWLGDRPEDTQEA